MHIIKLNATESTNSYIRELSVDKTLDDYTIVVAKHQTKGKGQMGAQWNTDPGKNLTFSVLKFTSGLGVDDHFNISMMTSLAIRDSLQRFGIPKVLVKWPNDILSEEKKICGILIENIIKKKKIDKTIIGVGLNVNQSEFRNLPRATSMKIQTGRTFDLDELLIVIVTELKKYFDKYKEKGSEIIQKKYLDHLFRIEKPSTFRNMTGDKITGIIKGIDQKGNLMVLHEDHVITSYKFKEVELLY